MFHIDGTTSINPNKELISCSLAANHCNVERRVLAVVSRTGLPRVAGNFDGNRELMPPVVAALKTGGGLEDWRRP